MCARACACARMPTCIYEERSPSPASSARISSAARPVALRKAGPSGHQGPQCGRGSLPLQALRPLAFLQPDNASWCGRWGLGMPSPVVRATVAWEAGGGLGPARPPPRLYHQPLVTFAGSQGECHLHTPIAQAGAQGHPDHCPSLVPHIEAIGKSRWLYFQNVPRTQSLLPASVPPPV